MGVSVRGCVAAAFTFVLGSIGMAHAAPVTAHDVRTVVSALQDNGFQAKLDKTDDGDPMIISGADGNKFAMTFSSCTAHADCSYIELIASWNDVKPELGAKIASSWQAEENYSGLIYLPNEGQLTAYHYLITGKDGISPDSLVDSISYFMKDFVSVGNRLAKEK